MEDAMEGRKAEASSWFRSLRDRITAAFEGLEDAHGAGVSAGLPAGRFEVTPTAR